MQLEKAIKQVARICPKKKELYKKFGFIRFFSAYGDFPAYLVGTDGDCSVVAILDAGVAVPNVVLDAGMLLKAARDKSDLSIVDKGNCVEIWANQFGEKGKLLYQLDSKSNNEIYLNVLGLEGFQQIPDWELLSRVFYAASKDMDGIGGLVHFSGDFVEATDKARLARVRCKNFNFPEMIVPHRIFKSWPKGSVEMFCDGDTVYFRIGDEIRIVTLYKGGYPATWKIVDNHEGPSVLVDVKVFLDVVQRGMKVSEYGLVSLNFVGSELILKAWMGQGSDQSFEAIIPVIGSVDSGNVLVKGKYIEDALKNVPSDIVKVGYNSTFDPLRLETGVYKACVWQMAY